MRKTVLATVSLLLTLFIVQGQPTAFRYRKSTFMIPMRDGVRLFTVVLQPETPAGLLPFLIKRTPYGADVFPDTAGIFVVPLNSPIGTMAADGYFFVYQDIRGKFKSEGSMQIHQPLHHRGDSTAVDESTDTWDTIDWLLKNISGNNGRAGIYGISYPGWLALVGSVHAHPALKASSEQACMGDLFIGDDFHHNGAFRLSYGFEYTYEVENDHTKGSVFPFPQHDLFNWYLHLGPLEEVNRKYFHDRVPTWNNFIAHPDYDGFWVRNSPLSYVKQPEVPQLHVGGYYDQEDINGPQLMYRHMERLDTFSRNHIVLGPWYHGQWGGQKGDSLGSVSFGSTTGVWFRDLQKKWFDYYLKDIGDGRFAEAYAFQTGSNRWKTYENWPPKGAIIRKLYTSADGGASFLKPVSAVAHRDFVSDPAHPVPYRMLPIEATYAPGSHWRTWHVQDQRFVTTRPDVASFVMDTLTNELTVTGNIRAHLFASTTGSDADWIVKLIDVYPAIDSSDPSMSGYQLPVAMEVFRGRYRKSFSTPQSLTPGKPEEFLIDLHDINHVFRKGHAIMIQVQSSWFPVIDRNPQTFVPSIYAARPSDYKKQTHSIFCSARYPTCVDLPVMPND